MQTETDSLSALFVVFERVCDKESLHVSRHAPQKCPSKTDAEEEDGGSRSEVTGNCCCVS